MKRQTSNQQSIVITKCAHLSLQQQNKLLELLIEVEELFYVTRGDWNTKPISYGLKEGTMPYHGRPSPAPRVHKDAIVKELNRLCDLEVMEFQPASGWVSRSFIIPKK